MGPAMVVSDGMGIDKGTLTADTVRWIEMITMVDTLLA